MIDVHLFSSHGFKHMLCHVLSCNASRYFWLWCIKMSKSWCTNKATIKIKGVIVWLTTRPHDKKCKIHVYICYGQKLAVLPFLWRSWVVNLADITCIWIYFIYGVCINVCLLIKQKLFSRNPYTSTQDSSSN